MAFDPLTVYSIASTGLKALNGYLDNKQTADTFNLNNQVLDSQSKSIIASAEQIVRQQERNAEKVIGRQILTYAKAGLKISGAPSDVIFEQTKNFRHDIIMTRLNAVTQTAGIRAKSIENSIKAARAKSQANSSLFKGILSIGGIIAKEKTAEGLAGA